MAAALDVIWPLTDELFQADPVAARLPGVAADPAELRAEVDAVLDAVLAAATLDRPQAAPLARVGGQVRPRRRAHRGVRLPARRDAERRPRPPGRDMVTAAGLAAARAVAAAVPDPELPHADRGRPRHPARRRRPRASALVVTITPTYSGCPALREIARRPACAGWPTPASPTSRCGPRSRPAWTQRLDHRARAGRKLSAAGIAPPHAAPAPRRARSRSPSPDPAPTVACPRCGSADTTQTVGVRRDRVQGAVPLRDLPRAVRAREGDLMRRQCARDRASTRSPWRRVDPLHRRLGRGHLRRARPSWPSGSPSRPGSR